MLQAVLHAAFGLLLVIAVARLFADPEVGHVRWVALVGAAALGAVYAVGPLSQRQWTHPRVALVWLAVVTALWALLLLVSPDFSWVRSRCSSCTCTCCGGGTPSARWR